MANTSFQQTLGQSLQQTITPQMQQSLQVLQAPALELRKLVQQELLENPTLEDDTQEISLEDEGLANDEFNDEEFEKEFDELSQLDDEWRDYMAQSQKARVRTSEDDERRAFLLDSVTVPVTLQEHLLGQLSVADVTPAERHTVEMLIGMIDETGFLSSPIEDIAMSERIPFGQMQSALTLLQSFDPVGIAAIDLRECLLIQLNRLGKGHSLEARIVTSHLDDLAKKRYPMLAKKFGVNLEQIIQAAQFIATLNPRPGQAFRQDSNSFVQADATVSWDEGEWVVTLNNAQIPQLRISNTYKDIMSEPDKSPDVRRYIRDKIRGGKFLIRSISQRQDTIEKIAREIVKHQPDFLDSGPSQLRPLNMAKVAEAVGVHETTVSRAVNGKYLATPQGLFEMKYFFTTGYHTDAGENLSNTSVKNALLELVKNEPIGRAYSDQDLVEMLNEQGIPIARRTVAKYRKELNILPSNMRRRY